MILTGKAKEDFNKWSKTMSFGYVDSEPRFLDVNFEDLNSNLKNEIIIRWFDSVGIYIEINRATNQLKFFSWFFTITDIKGIHQNSHLENFVKEDKRDKVTEQAIIKANEIYNERNQ